MNEHKRPDLTGEDEEWYACDEAGRVAVLFSNECKLPESAAFANESVALELHMTNLPLLSPSQLDPRYEREARLISGWRDEYREEFFASLLARSRSGLHVYRFNPAVYQYQRLALPEYPLLLWSLPREIRNLIAHSRFEKSFVEHPWLDPLW